ncbi:MAG: class I SAM-dependent methyltransferase [Candidatus Calescibacterium sp.]|nr:class I SAM-dependent methyltransferase [Candidatus Calescibacterium sp.]
MWENLEELLPKLEGRLLDIGCGIKPYEKLCKVEKYIGLEIEGVAGKKADYYYDGNRIPFEDKYFDSILSTEVLEHVFNPDQFMREVNRVTKIGGKLVITVPFVWDEHEQPFDYARYSSYGLKYILNLYGFEVIEHRKTNNGLEAIFQLLNAYIYKKLCTKGKFLHIFTLLFFVFPINLLGLIFSKIFPRNDDLYIDNVVLAKKVKDV